MGKTSCVIRYVLDTFNDEHLITLQDLWLTCPAVSQIERLALFPLMFSFLLRKDAWKDETHATSYLDKMIKPPYLQCSDVLVVEGVLDVPHDTGRLSHATLAQQDDLEVVAALLSRRHLESLIS